MKLYVKKINVSCIFHATTEPMYVLVHCPRLILTTPIYLWSGNIPVSLSLIATSCQ